MSFKRLKYLINGFREYVSNNSFDQYYSQVLARFMSLVEQYLKSSQSVYTNITGNSICGA